MFVWSLRSSVGQTLTCCSNPAGGGNLLNRKRVSIAHSLPLLPSHHPDMIEILLRRAKTMSSIHLLFFYQETRLSEAFPNKKKTNTCMYTANKENKNFKNSKHLFRRAQQIRYLPKITIVCIAWPCKEVIIKKMYTRVIHKTLTKYSVILLAFYRLFR